MKTSSKAGMQYRKLEVKEMASMLKEILNNIEKNKNMFAALDNGEFGNTYEAIRELLKCKLCNEKPQHKDFQRFIHALYNDESPVPQMSDYGFVKTSIPSRNPPPGPRYTQRGIAEALNRYLQCFVQTPRLAKQNPLGLCKVCNALIEKQRSTRKVYCTSKCRSADYNKDHMNKISKAISENRKKQKDNKEIAAQAKALRAAQEKARLSAKK